MSDLLKNLIAEREAARNDVEELSIKIQKEKHREKIRLEEERLKQKAPEYGEFLKVKKELTRVRRLCMDSMIKEGDKNLTEIAKLLNVSSGLVSARNRRNKWREKLEAFKIEQLTGDADV